jgi:hypothetical protein
MRPSTFVAAAPWIGLALFLVSSEVLTAALRAHGRPELGMFVLLRSLGWLGWLGWWYEDDSRKRGQAPGLDMGLWLALAWPLIILYRLLVSGRKQAAQWVALAFSIYLVAKLVGLVVYALQSR